jgi:hypothetical protein
LSRLAAIPVLGWRASACAAEAEQVKKAHELRTGAAKRECPAVSLGEERQFGKKVHIGQVRAG